MSVLTNPSQLATLRQSADPARRPAAPSLGSPGNVAGQFATLLAGMRDEQTPATAADTVAVPAAGGGTNDNSVADRPFGLATVQMLLGDDPSANAGDSDVVATMSRRRRRAQTEDVSGRLIETAINSGQNCDGRWMTILMSAQEAG